MITLIQYVVPGAECVVMGEPKNAKQYAKQVVWHDDRPQPTWAELQEARPQFEIYQVNAMARRNRANAYKIEADPLFFKWQRNEGTEKEWLEKVEEIKERYPYSS